MILAKKYSRFQLKIYLSAEGISQNLSEREGKGEEKEETTQLSLVNHSAN